MSDRSAAAVCSWGCCHRQSDDPYVHARNLSGWRREFVQISSGQFRGEIVEAEVDTILAADESLSQAIFQVGPVRPDGLALGVVATDAAEALWYGQRVGREHVCCAFGETELVMRTSPGVRLRWLFVPWEVLGEDCRRRLEAAVGKGAATFCLRSPGLARRLVDCVESILVTAHAVVCDGGDPAPASRAVYDAAVSVVADFVLAYAGTGSPVPARLRTALRILHTVRPFLRDNVGESLGIIDFCDVAAASQRTIRAACQAITGESPMSFLKAMRLNQVRRCLLMAGCPVKVTQIGLRWGFLHLPQFAHDYRRLFGELPSETIHRQLQLHAERLAPDERST